MIYNHNLPFGEQYQANLRLYLSEPSRTKSSPHAAGLLGREAADSGMDILELVRTHEQAMAEISAPSNPDKKPSPGNRLTPGGTFLLETLTLLEERNRQTHSDVCQALRESEQSLALESAHSNELLSESQQVKAQSQQFVKKLLLAQEEERREISRELHDEIAQILAGINVQLAALQGVGVVNFESYEKTIQQTQKMIEESVDVVHRYARKLRPSMLDDLGLIPALRSYIKDLPRPRNLKVHFEAIPEVETMDNTRLTVFYRVVQEALLNAVRHAEAETATVRLLKIPDGIRLEVSDDGKAFPADGIFTCKDYKRLGLLGMKERVEMVGGVFCIESKAGRGTTVRADIPYPKIGEKK